ncbi:MAG: xanthine dehydrogenase family protein molybdopterin-binding subunit [Candidatus Rokubacteria bacterium]|nr:xanthine dehydrogenase family protein molybdopterin-binding subunit [Candidatus Rokubacteria bacterium]
MKRTVNESRRAFLKATAAAGGGLLIAFRIPGALRFAEAATASSAQVNAFVKIGTDNIVTVVIGQSEMGQGVWTSIPMMLAEELEADWSKIRVEQGGVDPAFANPRYVGFRAQGGFQGTGGSSSVRNVGVNVRKAGAAARQMLITAAAQGWGVNEEECYAEKNMVIHRPSGKKLSYGSLAEKAAKVPLPKYVPLKNPQDFKIIGKSLPLLDTPSKVSGKTVYGIDVKVPGMLVATVAQCPVFGGKAASFNADKAKAIKGVRHVVQISSGIAVVADDFWSAKKGRDALEITWDEGPLAKVSQADLFKSFAELSQKPGAVRRNDGDVEKALKEAAKKIEAVYEVPFVAHVCMEPMNATAQWRGDSVEIWAPTQAQSWTQAAVAKHTGLPPEKIKINTTFLGGGFGRRLYWDFAIDAVETSKAVGAPVKVIWTREDDIQHDFYRPASYNVLAAGLDEKGMPVAWKHRIVGTSILQYFPPFSHLLRKDGMDPTSVGGAGDIFPYNVPNVYVDYTLHNPGVPSGFWRSVGNSQNAFIMESFMDELAAAARKDAFEYRLQLLKNPRDKGVLELAAHKAKWGSPLPAGVYRGIAEHFSYNSYCAQVAEVSVGRDGKAKVHRIVAAADPGWVVHPERFKAQIESGILYGLSGALFGEITIKNGRVEQSNFDNYPVPRMSDMPKIEVYILQGEGEQGGAGEPGVPSASPAVANAIFAATGKRIRKLPVRAEDLRTA